MYWRMSEFTAVFWTRAEEKWLLEGSLLRLVSSHDEHGHSASAAEKPLRLKQRTEEFARNSVQACRDLKGSYKSRYLRTQLIRSMTSVAANYRARLPFEIKTGIHISFTAPIQSEF